MAVIEGGLGYTGQARREEQIRVEDVEAEAARRLRKGRVNEWRTRELITGTPVPADIKYLELQINFATRALCKLSPIPPDFADDLYWPTCWRD
ncbi:hypothetical protein [uncultured Devosia sp.]|uniref:hypothetical protein n=1 Tax=uncultured Devosia sp. TaxID=211434 RepID=UPI0035CAFFDB